MNIITRLFRWIAAEWRFQFPARKPDRVPQPYSEWNGLLVDHRREDRR